MAAPAAGAPRAAHLPALIDIRGVATAVLPRVLGRERAVVLLARACVSNEP